MTKSIVAKCLKCKVLLPDVSRCDSFHLKCEVKHLDSKLDKDLQKELDNLEDI